MNGVVIKTLKLTQLKIKEITKFIKASAIENEKSNEFIINKSSWNELIIIIIFGYFSTSRTTNRLKQFVAIRTSIR